MKRRLFLQGLLGASASLPVLAKVPIEERPVLDVKAISEKVSGNTIITPSQITREALEVYNENLQWSAAEQAVLRGRKSPPLEINRITR